MVMLKDGKDGKPLNYEEITSVKLIQTNCENTWKISTMESCREPIRNLKKLKEKEFGWLSPTGRIYRKSVRRA